MGIKVSKKSKKWQSDRVIVIFGIQTESRFSRNTCFEFFWKFLLYHQLWVQESQKMAQNYLFCITRGIPNEASNHNVMLNFLEMLVLPPAADMKV